MDSLSAFHGFQRNQNDSRRILTSLGEVAYDALDYDAAATAYRAALDLARGVDRVIPLLALARIWKLEGDWMTCQGCKRPLIASREGEILALR